jgi:UDP-N-acetylmuramoyl-L-alanyl-D-glutamate--2,6-diaminopimelate ligase
MEIIGENNEVKVIVDYAHTPDALKSALSAVSSHFDGKIWCIFGCGGNRDKGKRSIMGEVAEQYADYLIVTDDNPRNESGDEIIQHILSGIGHPQVVTIIRDRAKAIEFAIKNASARDVVLIAGKGHETCQEILGTKNKFSDSAEARVALEERGLTLDR